MSLSTYQLQIIQFVEVLSGSLSILGSGYIIIDSYRNGLKNMELSDKFIFVLSVSDFFQAIAFAVGNAGIGTPFCQLQAILIQFFCIVSILWNSCMAHNLYKWVVRKNDMVKLTKRFRKYLIFCIGISTIFVIILLSLQSFDDSILWCWIGTNQANLRWPFFYVPLIFSWIYCIYIYSRVIQSFSERAGSANMVELQTLAVQKKIRQYELVFIFTWSFGLLNRIISSIPSLGTIFFINLLHVMFVPLQGFLNAIVRGGIFNRLYDGLRNSSSASSLEGGDISLPSIHHKDSTFTKTVFEKKTKVAKKLFVTTFNLGEAGLDSKSAEGEIVDGIKKWIPLGMDLYVIGLQECVCLAGIKTAVHDFLGGPNEWKMFSKEIGSDATAIGYHGYIALIVFAKTDDVLYGNFVEVEAAEGITKRGMNLGVTRASNKGTVGLPFRYYDTSLGFLVSHFASDSKGKNKIEKRNNDARSALQNISLLSDDIGFDAQLTVQHLFLLGDLNYRIILDESSLPTEVSVLECTAACAKMEAGEHGDDWLTKRYNLVNNKNNDYVDISHLNMWMHLLQFDEMMNAMKSGTILHGFEEPGGGPCFPPSYRRKRNAQGKCGNYCDKDVLVGAFTIKSGDGMVGSRAPSYTDRILTHSLPDRKDCLIPHVYTICDAILASDHRPVTALYSLMVNTTVVPKITSEEFFINASLFNAQIVMNSLEASPNPTASNEMIRVVVENENVEEEKEGFNYKPKSGKFDPNFPDRVVVIFPLPSEDPFEMQRKIADVENFMRTKHDRKQATLKKNKTLKRDENGYMLANPEKDSTMQSNINEFQYEEMTNSTGVSISAKVDPKRGVHALIGLINSKGDMYAQGVISLENKSSSQQMCSLTYGGELLGNMNVNINVKFT